MVFCHAVCLTNRKNLGKHHYNEIIQEIIRLALEVVGGRESLCLTR